MKPDYLKLYMDLAERISQMSHAKRLKVGSLIVKENTILSYGWNGTPAGWDNTCEDIVWNTGAYNWSSPEEVEKEYPYEGYHEGMRRVVRYKLKTKPEVLHAEMNCLMKVAKSTESSQGSTLFTTHAPCINCSKAIYQAGVYNVFYKDLYRTDEGIRFLEKCGVKISKLIEGNK